MYFFDLKRYRFSKYISIGISELWHLRNYSETTLLNFLSNKKNPLTSWGPCLHKDSGKSSLCEKTNIPFHIMHSSIHQRAVSEKSASSSSFPAWLEVWKSTKLRRISRLDKQDENKFRVYVDWRSPEHGFIVLLRTPVPKTIFYRSPTIHIVHSS